MRLTLTNLVDRVLPRMMSRIVFLYAVPRLPFLPVPAASSQLPNIQPLLVDAHGSDVPQSFLIDLTMFG